jgi:hypothetical protein
MYRPQFAYPTPPGCRDEEFLYSFDGSNTQMLNQDISTLTLRNIPLVLDQDAPFYWRGWKFNALRGATSPGGIPTAYAYKDVSIRLRDPYDNDLSNDWVPAVNYGDPINSPLQNNLTLLTGPPVLVEPEIYCPPGGVILAFILATAVPGGGKLGQWRASFGLYGVKRFKECNP